MKKKINIQMATVSAIAIILTMVFAVIIFYQSLRKEVFEELKTYSEIIMEEEELIKSISGPEQRQQWKEKTIRITIIRKDGIVVADTKAEPETMDNHSNRDEVLAAINDGEGTKVRQSDTLGKSTFYYAKLMENGNILRVSKDSNSVLSIVFSIFPFVIAVAVLMVIVCGVISHIFTKKLIEPIEVMAEHIDDISHDNIYPELVPFVNTIQKQHEDIIKNANMRQEFTANVSHELKTPIAAVSGYAELIENGMAKGEDAVKFARDIHRNSDRLLTLINDILRLSELDEGNGNHSYEQVNLYDVARLCVDMLELSAQKNNVTMSMEGDESCVVYANKQMMDELVYNLCDNGIRYNNPGGKVMVRVYKKGQKVVLRVSDTGIGISKEYQERIFERFFRVDKSRSKAKGGTGLGLAIVKHIVSHHNATLSIESEEGKGTVIEVEF